MQNLPIKLRQIELSMRDELGTLAFKNPSATEDGILTKTYGEAWKISPYNSNKRKKNGG